MSQTINLEISQGSRTLTLSQEEIRVIEAVSPTVDAERTEDGVQITVHDLHGTETVNLYDGMDGVGISGAVLNADYTLTLTFTDGSSYTTPSIRGAQGQPGQTGATPDISIGTVETLTPGSPVTVTITGTAENPVLSFGIPQGQQGTPGRDGVDGAPGRDGVDGQDGAPGKSAYQAAVEAGFTGTEAEFNEYLSGIGDLTEDVSQQKSAIEALDPLVDRKAGMLIDTASGAIASFVPDSTIDNLLGVSVAVEPVQDLHGYDSPWPAGGGANQWDEQWELGTIDPATGTNESSTVRWRSKNLIPIQPDTDYCYRCGIDDGEKTTGRVCYYDANGDYLSGNATFPGGGARFINPAVFHTPANAYYMRFSPPAADGTTYRNNTAINSPATVTTYSPYSNECPISGWNAVEVDATGANLFGGTVINGRVPFDLKPGVTYTASAQFVDPSVSTYFYIQRAPKGTGTYSTFGYILAGSARTPITFTADAGYDYAFWSNASYTNVKDVQIETGSTASAYRPYDGNRYVIQLGQTVYGGTLDVTAGTLTVDRAMVDMGALDWAAYSAGVNTYRAQIAEKALGDLNLICSAYKTEASAFANMTNGTIRGTTGNTYVYVRDNNYTDVISFKSAVTGQTIVYKLATPIEIQLDPVTIATIAGQTNNVWANTGDVSVEFAADLKHYIDSKIAAAVAALS